MCLASVKDGVTGSWKFVTGGKGGLGYVYWHLFKMIV